MKTILIELKLICMVLSPYLKPTSAQRWAGNMMEKIK